MDRQNQQGELERMRAMTRPYKAWKQETLQDAKAAAGYISAAAYESDESFIKALADAWEAWRRSVHCLPEVAAAPEEVAIQILRPLEEKFGSIVRHLLQVTTLSGYSGGGTYLIGDEESIRKAAKGLWYMAGRDALIDELRTRFLNAEAELLAYRRGSDSSWNAAIEAAAVRNCYLCQEGVPFSVEPDLLDGQHATTNEWGAMEYRTCTGKYIRGLKKAPFDASIASQPMLHETALSPSASAEKEVR